MFTMRQMANFSARKTGTDFGDGSPYILGCVDSKDSHLAGSMIQGCFCGGSFGCDGSLSFERRSLGADGSADHRSACPEGFDWTRKPNVRGRGLVDRADGFSLARSSGGIRGLEQCVPALQPLEHQGCLVADLRSDVR